MIPKRDTYPIEIAGLKRELPIFEVAPGVRIAVLNILGDNELVRACAQALTKELGGLEYDVIVTAEAKSIPIAYELSIISNRPYVVLRKKYKIYMGDTIKAETHSITTRDPQNLYLDEKDRQLVHGKRVLILDDVISTGSTLEGIAWIMNLAGAEVVGKAAILTEGDSDKWKDVFALGHLPIFTNPAA